MILFLQVWTNGSMLKTPSTGKLLSKKYSVKKKKSKNKPKSKTWEVNWLFTDAKECISKQVSLTTGTWIEEEEVEPHPSVGNSEFHGKPQWLKSVCFSWK